MSDETLIDAIIQDDNNAFKTLFSRYYQRLVGYITTYTNDLSAKKALLKTRRRRKHIILSSRDCLRF